MFTFFFVRLNVNYIKQQPKSLQEAVVCSPAHSGTAQRSVNLTYDLSSLEIYHQAKEIDYFMQLKCNFRGVLRPIKLRFI